MENLFEVLSDLAKWCDEQPGVLLWTLMQTCDGGAGVRGYQVFVLDHSSGECRWFANVHYKMRADLALGELAELIRAWLRGGARAFPSAETGIFLTPKEQSK